MSQNAPRPPRDHKPQRGGASGILVFILLAILGAVALFLLAERFPGALSSRDDQISFVYLIALGGFLLLSALGIRRLDRTTFSRYLRHGLLWAAIFIVIAGGYSYRTEIQPFGQRLMSDLVPGYGSATGRDEITYTRADDGHFYIDAEVSRVPVRFLVDTGASAVVLSPADAVRLGFDLSRVQFNQYFETANGTVRGARAVLSDLRLGDHAFRNVAVSINEAPMSNSLLGMTFLKQLESFEVRGDRLILRLTTGF